MALIDLSEYYQIQTLKDKCAAFLAENCIQIENILRVYESVKLYYSSQEAPFKILQTISTNITEILKTDQFLKAKKDTILDILQMDDLKVREEILFEAVS